MPASSSSAQIWPDKAAFAKLYREGVAQVVSTRLVADLETPVSAYLKLADGRRMPDVETIANPTIVVADLADLSERAHRHGAVVIVDNTFASPYLCRPFELGADLVVESTTKWVGGHSDVLAGAVAGLATITPAAGYVPISQGLWSSQSFRRLNLPPRSSQASVYSSRNSLWRAIQRKTVALPGIPASLQMARRLLPSASQAQIDMAT